MSRSNFKRAIETLSSVTDFDVFRKMQETGKPMVLTASAKLVVIKSKRGRERQAIRSAFWRLHRSKRYLSAVIAGAMMYDEKGWPAGPAGELDIAWAKGQMAQRGMQVPGIDS